MVVDIAYDSGMRETQREHGNSPLTRRLHQRDDSFVTSIINATHVLIRCSASRVEDATAVTFTGSTFSTAVDAGIASGNGTSGFLDGLIAEVAVTTAAATPQQIAELYHLAKALIPAPHPGGNGNQTYDGERYNRWDALNRLKEVRRVSDQAIIGQYTYDALGRRIRKVVIDLGSGAGGLNDDVHAGTTDYLYHSGGVQCCEERDGSDTVRKQYLWGRYIDELIQLKTLVSIDTGFDTDATTYSAGDYYLLSDLLYRGRALTDLSGNIVEAYDTDAYGNTLIFNAAGTGLDWWADDARQVGEALNELIFTGRRYDPETEFYFYRMRYYTPNKGRFISRDPIRYIDGMSLYAYVRSLPLVKVDLTTPSHNI